VTAGLNAKFNESKMTKIFVVLIKDILDRANYEIPTDMPSFSESVYTIYNKNKKFDLEQIVLYQYNENKIYNNTNPTTNTNTAIKELKKNFVARDGTLIRT